MYVLLYIAARPVSTTAKTPNPAAQGSCAIALRRAASSNVEQRYFLH